MIYSEIDGWFDFENVYHKIYDTIQNGRFVEVGAWKGRSTAFMANLLKTNGAKFLFYVVDTWEGSPELFSTVEEIGENRNINHIFFQNMLECGVLNYIRPINLTSIEASFAFEDESLSGVFIDATHGYNEALNDIQVWLPKIRKGGIIAGHDYCDDWSGVKRAVDEVFGDDIKIFNPFSATPCWWHVKK